MPQTPMQQPFVCTIRNPELFYLISLAFEGVPKIEVPQIIQVMDDHFSIQPMVTTGGNFEKPSIYSGRDSSRQMLSPPP